MAEEIDSSAGQDARRKAVVKALVETLEPYIPALAEKFQTLQGQAVEIVATFQAAAIKLERQWQAALERAQPILETLSKIDWAALQVKLEALPERSKVAMQHAADRGWFFGWNGSLQDVMEFVDSIDGLEASELDDILAQYHRDSLDAFSAALMSCYPHRAEAVSAAVDAHKLGSRSGYLLSVPVLLAQADGILSEVTDTESALQRAKKSRDQLRAAEWLKGRLADIPDSLDLLDPILTLWYDLHGHMLKDGERRRSKLDALVIRLGDLVASMLIVRP